MLLELLLGLAHGSPQRGSDRSCGKYSRAREIVPVAALLANAKLNDELDKIGEASEKGR